MDDKIMFGICTYNRKDIVSLSSLSLSHIHNLGKVQVWVFDDNSQEYDKDYLQSVYPYAKGIEISEINRGADVNSLKMLNFFCNSSNEWLFIADSDLIYSQNIIEIIQRCIEEYRAKKYNGVISLFNTFTHPVSSAIDDFLCRKDEVGAAGVLVNKEIAKLILESVNSEFPYDVQFSKMLKENNYDILCTRKSYVQHIGIEGYNSLYYTFDWGKEFVLDNMQNAEIINKVTDKLMERIAEGNKKTVEDRILEDIAKKRIGLRFLLKTTCDVIAQKICFHKTNMK